MRTLLLLGCCLLVVQLQAQQIRRPVARPPRPKTPAAATVTPRLVQLDTITPGPTSVAITTTKNTKLSAGFLCEGFVRQPNGQPLAGFLVQVERKNSQTRTGNDGSFRLLLQKGDLLLFSKPGYVTVEMDPFTNPAFSSVLMKVTMNVTEQFYFAHQTQTSPLKIFPLPYPAPSGVYNLDQNLFTQLHTLSEVDNMFKSALDNCRYDEKRYYYAPHGFALVTAMEQTSEAGLSLDPPARWSAVIAEEFNSPLDYLKALFSVPEGYFRVFVFLVTDVDPRASGRSIAEVEARKWLNLGYTKLPDELMALPLTPAHSYSLLVYQYKKEPGRLGEQVQQLTAREHFQRSYLERYLTNKP